MKNTEKKAAQKVAIVHYWLVTMRGGEKVLEALLEMFPQADIFTHVYKKTAVSELINSHRIFTTYINRLPFAKRFYQKYMPLMPVALNSLDLQNYDLVFSSESGPAKGVVPHPDALHICYCHSPMRYLWDMYHEYFRKSGFITKFFMKRMIPQLRLWDVQSSNLVDVFAANSSYVAKRIMRYYRRESDIVFPPVDIEKYKSVMRNTMSDEKKCYLFFGQLVGYKRADIAIEACVNSKRQLIIAGSGAKKIDIKRYEKTGFVQFLGHVSDEQLPELYAKATALIFPGIEDFGIIPVEAQAAGCPVIAYKKGGVLDTVKENVTGVFFGEQTVQSLVEALERFEKMESAGAFANRAVFSAHVQQFSKDEFKKRIKRIIDQNSIV
ncbi:MAG: glycosyltransferase [Treponemataceae bacterium]|nr:MAG: glycosyltransferase [Treponemataceae bacterium]